MFVTAEDFNSVQYHIPNLAEDSSQFFDFVGKEEGKMLRKILGSPLYEAFIENLLDEWDELTAFEEGDEVDHNGDHYAALQDSTGIEPGTEDAEGVWEAQPENKWLKLKHGGTYRYLEKTYRWVGMNELLIPYIHAMYLRAQTQGDYNGNGLSLPRMENADRIDPAVVVSKHYNEFSEMVGHRYCQKDTLFGFLYNSAATYFEGILDDDYTSIENYMLDRFEAPGTMNFLNL